MYPVTHQHVTYFCIEYTSKATCWNKSHTPEVLVVFFFICLYEIVPRHLLEQVTYSRSACGLFLYMLIWNCTKTGVKSKIYPIMEAYIKLLWSAVLIRNSLFGICNNNKLQWKSKQSLIQGKTVLQFTASLSIVQQGTHGIHHTLELV